MATPAVVVTSVVLPGWHCCIKAKGVLTKHQSSGADPSDTVENYNKPGISKV